MKIATYNINGINGRLAILLRWLARAGPDVVCLQELKCESGHFPEKAIKDAGYHAIWRGEKSWNGVAILSKEPIRQLREDLPGEDETFTHSRYIEGFTFGIVIGCLYLPNGNPYPGPKFDYKLRWFSRLSRHAKTLLNTGLPVMLVGDYNVMPTELDTYKPEKFKDNALFRTESREAYAALVNQGWTDAIRTLFPGERIYTFWDYLRNAYGRDAGLRLDHFLLNPLLAARLQKGGVDKEVRGWEKASDHAPVWIELGETAGAIEDQSQAIKTAGNSHKDKKSIKKSGTKSKIKNKTALAISNDIQELLDKAPTEKMPREIKAMKATQVDRPFNDPEWLYEIKWDGYRALAFVEKGKVELVSRNNLLYDQFSPINKILEGWDMDLVLDGEIVVLDEIGMPVFGALQNWRSEKELNLVFYVFDIIWYDKKLLTAYTLKERRSILEAVLPGQDGSIVRLSHFFDADGEAFYQTAKRMGLEGIIAKKADSTYTGDIRSRDWLKVKAKLRQEVIIAGYTQNEGSGKFFSALALGVYDSSGVLRYIGKVGTGFNDALQKDLLKRFAPLETSACPFDIEPDVDEPSRFRPRRLGAKPTWLLPELVCEVEFAEISRDGRLRQASFKGLRTDKDPMDVVLEIPALITDIVEEPNEYIDDSIQLVEKAKKSSLKLAGPKYTMPDKLLLEGKAETVEKKIDGHLIKFTHLNKLYWPEDGISKRDMFNYYDQVAPYMIPYLVDRPMSLNRFPGGIHGQSFYQKNVAETAPDWAHTMPHTNEKGEEKEYLLGYDRATLLWMATLGCIEMNPWFSRVSSPDHPDYCVIDLDPDKNTFEQVIETARVTHSVLDAMGVPSYAKTSGSTGIHIYIPLSAKYSYDQSQLFAQVVVKLVHRELPSYTTLERMISNRKGKMYLDFLQNRPGATIAGVYSLRPKPGATVSMPLDWEEVKPGLTMRHFTIHNAPDRLKETGDLFAGVLAEGIDMATAIAKARETFG